MFGYLDDSYREPDGELRRAGESLTGLEEAERTSEPPSSVVSRVPRRAFPRHATR